MHQGAHRHIDTDEHIAVVGSGSWLYRGRRRLRLNSPHPRGQYQGRIAGDVDRDSRRGSLDRRRRCRNVGEHDVVPAVVFAEPHVARRAHRVSRAGERGLDVEGSRTMSVSVAGASVLHDGSTERAKLVVDRASDTVVGPTFVRARLDRAAALARSRSWARSDDHRRWSQKTQTFKATLAGLKDLR